MRILILEDEAPAAKRLTAQIKLARGDSEIVAILDSVADAALWLDENPHPDVAFFDIRLVDGTCFDLFDVIRLEAPVIFCTAYDEFALRAFKANGVDYLLKPVEPAALAAAFAKLDRLRNWSSDDQRIAARRAAAAANKGRFKSRFVIRAGSKLRPMAVSEAAAFCARDKGVVAHLKSGESFFVDYALAELEDVLDPGEFFRISRAAIVAADSIESLELVDGRWRVTLARRNGALDVSRQRAAAFRAWLSE
ncbi:MAG: LytTR family DNA-binding domain-containing protein [Parvularculaceae bacterium]